MSFNKVKAATDVLLWTKVSAARESGDSKRKQTSQRKTYFCSWQKNIGK